MTGWRFRLLWFASPFLDALCQLNHLVDRLFAVQAHDVVVEHLPHEPVHEAVPVERIRRLDEARMVRGLERFGDIEVVTPAHACDEIDGELVADHRRDAEE